MVRKTKKTPELTSGLAQKVMLRMMEQVKRHRGLKSFIEQHGVKSKWLKTDVVYDTRLSAVVKIIESKALYQDATDFMTEWMQLGQFIVGYAQKDKQAELAKTLTTTPKNE